MALAGRSTRRGGAGFRWIAIGVLITLAVLLVDASLKSRSPKPIQQLAAATWVDRVLPLIGSSTAEGQVISDLWANGLHSPASVITSSVDQLASEAAGNYQTVARLRPPDSLLGAAGLLEAALLSRSNAAADLKSVFTSTLGAAATAPPPSAARFPSGSSSTSVQAMVPSTVAPPAVASAPADLLASVTKAANEIQVGDSAYSLFTGAVPASVGVHMPPSVWVRDLAPYQPQAAQVFLTSLQNAVVTTPVHQVKIFAVTTSPGPVSTVGGIETIPDAQAMTVTVVVADTGNQPESNLTVTAALSPAGSGAQSVRDFVNLKVGQAYTVNALGPLNPTLGVPLTLTVTVAPASGPTPPATSTITFQMPPPPPPSTSTTTPGASSTTSTSVRG